MESILITGAQGFIGSLLTQELKKTFDRVYSQHFDVTDKKKTADILREIKPRVIYHLASPTDVNACEKNPAPAYEVIVGGTENLLEALPVSCRFVLASSMMVYREPLSGKNILDEGLGPEPLTQYGKLKLLAEKSVETWSKKSGGRFVNLRVGTHTHSTQTSIRFLSRLLKEAKEQGQLRVSQELNFQGRDIGAAADLVNGLRQLMEAEIESGAYNICTGRARNLGRLAQILSEELEVPLEFEGQEPEQENFYCGSYAKFEAATGWQPKVLTDDDFIKYYLRPQAI